MVLLGSGWLVKSKNPFGIVREVAKIRLGSIEFGFLGCCNGTIEINLKATNVCFLEYLEGIFFGVGFLFSLKRESGGRGC